MARGWAWKALCLALGVALALSGMVAWADAYDLSDDGAWRVHITNSTYIEVRGVYNAPTDYRSSLTIGGSLKHNGMTFKVGSVGKYPNISDYWFSNMPSLTTLNIGDPVMSVGGFSGSKKLTTVNLADSVTLISLQGFSSCPALKSVNVGNKLKTVGMSAFTMDKQLTAIRLPDTVTSIGEYAFNGTGLIAFDVPSKVTTLRRGTFKNCTSLTSITIPTSVTTIEDDCFLGCSGVNAVYAGSESQWAGVSVGANNGALNVTFKIQGGGNSGDTSTTTPRRDVCNCKADYAGTYVVKGTDGRLAINSGHGSASSGFVQLGTIPEGATVTISKASGYYGRGKSSGHWGHVTYNGVTGYCAMNYLEKADSITLTPASSCATCNAGYAGYYVVRGTSGALAINSGHGSASSGYTQLGTIPEGATVYISKATGYSGRGKSSGQWGHVTYNGVSGCCAMNYLDVTDSTDTCSADYAGYYRVKNTSGALGLNNGHGYGGSYTQLATIPEGTLVYVSKAMNYKGLGKSSGYWGHVTYNGVSGYSSMNYLEFVSKDVTPPTVGSLSYDNLTVSGFDVHASVSDDIGISRVQCAVWTQTGGQDDLPSNWSASSACSASVSNGVATYHVSFSDHWEQRDVYNVHMYAYDQAGNSALGTLSVNVDAAAPFIDSAKVLSLNSKGYDLAISASDADSGVSEVRVCTWNSVDGESEKAYDGRIFSPAASQSATLHIPAEKSGVYHSTVTAVDAMGNVSSSTTLTATVEAVAPSVSGISVSDAGESGFTVNVTAKDNNGLSKVIVYAWTPDNDVEGGGMDGMDAVAEYSAEVSGTSGSCSVRVNTADLGREVDTRYSVYAVAVDLCGNRSGKSAVSTLRVRPSGARITLPASLKAVEQEAFSGIAGDYVILPSGCATLKDGAFSGNAGLRYVYIPTSVTAISETAFANCPQLSILAPIGSYAQTFAQSHNIPWIHKDK